MQTSFIHFADHICHVDSGKLAVIGIFRHLQVAALPTTVPVHVAFELVMDPVEAKSKREIELQVVLCGPDGEELLKIEGKGKIGEVGVGPGMVLHHLRVPIPFKRSGPHRLAILVGGQLVGETSLEVTPSQHAKAA